MVGYESVQKKRGNSEHMNKMGEINLPMLIKIGCDMLFKEMNLPKNQLEW